jgi:hypothetical protein
MKRVINQDRINRNALLSNIGSIGGLLLLLASVMIPLFVPALTTAATVMLVLGLGISMVGIYFANRWVRKPRPEEKLSQELKGLGDAYVIYHYPKLPIDHVILTPGGIIVLETNNLSGAFQYRDGKWKESMTIGRALRYIVEEHLGNPTQAAQEGVDYLRRMLSSRSKSLSAVPIKPIVAFIHPAAHLDVKGSLVPVCSVDKLRKQVNSSGPKLNEAVYTELEQYLESVTR